MKKNVISLLIIFCCLCFSAYTGDADVHAIDSDCEYLKTIIEEASIDISKNIDEGLDPAKLIEDIKDEYVPGLWYRLDDDLDVQELISLIR